MSTNRERPAEPIAKIGPRREIPRSLTTNSGGPLRNTRLFTLALALGAAAPIVAQVSETTESIGYGETISNSLTQDDAKLSDNTYYKAYVFLGAAGDTITVHLSSPDFNAQLIVSDSADTVIGSDDNSGGSCNSYVTAVLPHGGRYAIFANTAGVGELGRFQLTLQQGVQPPGGGTPCRGFLDHRGTIWIGGAVEGTLGEGSAIIGKNEYFDIWLLPQTEGQTFTADLVSDDFDAVLMLYRGFTELVTLNDDGAGGCNSRVVYAPPDMRPYRLIVRSRGERQGGSYILRVAPGAEPILTAPPCNP